MKNKIIITTVIFIAIILIYIVYPRSGTFGELILDKTSVDKYSSVSLNDMNENSLGVSNSYDEALIKELIFYLEGIKIKEYHEEYLQPEYIMKFIGSNEKTSIIKTKVSWYKEGKFSASLDSMKEKYYKIEDEDFDMEKIKAMFSNK